MNSRMIKQIHKDYEEILSREAGLRIFGGIFYMSRINGVGLSTEYMQGRRDMGLMIANTIREVNPRLIAECEIAYKGMKGRYENGEHSGDSGNGNDSGEF